MNKTKMCYIMRGLPGSGKSTVVSHLCDPNTIFSTDKYFLNENGVYIFDGTKLGRYHQRNRDDFTTACRTALISTVAVDNTNIRKKDMEAYINIAEDNNYNISVITVGSSKDAAFQRLCAERNLHGVPLASIQRMGLNFEV